MTSNMISDKKPNYTIHLLVSLLLTLIVLFLHKDHYWSPYVTTQDWVGSAYAHGCAIANEIGLKKNPFMIHDVDFVHHRIHEYTHWPNGHFFIFYLIIKLFGNTEMVGRSFAVALNVIAIILMVFAFRDKRGLLFYAVPMLLLTPIARDAIPYVFIEPSFHFWIGFAALSVSFVETSEGLRLSRILFRTSLILAPFFAHLMLPFLLLGAITRFLFHKNKKELIIDVIILFGVYCCVFLALAWSEKGLYEGGKDLFLQFLHRSNIEMRFEEETQISVVRLADIFIYKLKHNLLVFWYLLPLAWIFCFIHRKSIAFLLPAAVINILIMANYVGPHVFAQYNLIMISFVTVFFFVAYLLNVLTESITCGLSPETKSNNSRNNYNIIFKIAIFISVSIFACYEVRIQTTSYRVEPDIVNLRNTFNSLKTEIENSECNCFDRISLQNGSLIRYNGRTISLYGQLFLGEKVLASIKRNETALCGGINLEERTLLCDRRGLDSIPYEKFVPGQKAFQ